MSSHDQKRESLAVLVKETEQKFAGPSLAEFANDPPIRKHYAVADAILREFDVTPHTEDMGPAANCHLCVGAGGYEDHDGEWIECSCQRKPQQWIPDMPRGERIGYSEVSRLPERRGEPSDPTHDARDAAGVSIDQAREIAASRRVQAEPSDAQVEAAARAILPDDLFPWETAAPAWQDYARRRAAAALRAAQEAR